MAVVLTPKTLCTVPNSCACYELTFAFKFIATSHRWKVYLKPYTSVLYFRSVIFSSNHNTSVQNIEIKSLADDQILQGYRWSIPNPVAVMNLVHGFGEHCGRYSELAEHLNEHGIEVIGVDLRGHGRTAGRRGVSFQYSHIYGDVRALIAESARLHPNLPRFLFGHSMGGGLVLHHGLSPDPDSLSGYLVSAPMLRANRRLPFYVRWAVKTLRKLIPTGTIRTPISGHKVSTIPQEQELYRSDALNHNRLGYGLAVGMVETGQHVLDNATQWNKPLCLWHSQADQITDFTATEQFAAHAQQCDFTAFNDVQHEMHHDYSRDQVVALMVDFMTGD